MTGNEFLRQQLPWLYEGDRVAQEDVYCRFFNALHHYAWKRVGDEHEAEDVALEGLNDLFRRCAKRKLKHEENPLGFLYRCVTRRAIRLLKKRGFMAQMRITAIDAGPPTRITAMNHGVCDSTKWFKISRSNSDPPIDGRYNGADGVYQIIDGDTIELSGVVVEKAGDKGTLHVRQRKPATVSMSPIGDGGNRTRFKAEARDDGPCGETKIEELLEECAHVLTVEEREILRMNSKGANWKEIGEAIGRSGENVRKTDYLNAVKKLKRAIRDSSAD